VRSGPGRFPTSAAAALTLAWTKQASGVSRHSLAGSAAAERLGLRRALYEAAGSMRPARDAMRPQQGHPIDVLR
jgi:hypothetical protein